MKEWIRIMICAATIVVVTMNGLVNGSEGDSVNDKAIDVTSLEQLQNLISSGPTFVMFYVEWCNWCRMALPEFDAAANLITHLNPPVNMAKVNCALYRDIREYYKATEYPYFVLFYENETNKYMGGRKRSSFLDYVETFMGVDKTIQNKEQLDNLIDHIKDKQNVVIGVFSNESNKEFVHAARSHFHDTLYGSVSSPELVDHLINNHILPNLYGHVPENTLKNLSASPFIVLLEHTSKYAQIYTGGIHDEMKIKEFFHIYRFSEVTQFTGSVAGELFTKENVILFLIYNSNQDNSKELEQFKQVASDYRGKIIFSSCGNQENAEKRLISLLGLDEEEFPILRIVTYNHDQALDFAMLKFKPEASSQNTINKNFIKKFVDNYLNKEITPYIKSDPIPEYNYESGPVFPIVGLSYTDLVLNSKNDVLLMVYAPWCGHCKRFEPEYKEIAWRLKSTSGIVVAKIDGSGNEIPGLPITGYPSFFLFVKSNPEPDILQYAGPRSIRYILEWLQKFSLAPIHTPTLLKQNLEDIKNPTDSNNSEIDIDEL